MTSDRAVIEAAADKLIDWVEEQWRMIILLRRRVASPYGEVNPGDVVYWCPEALR